MTRDPLRKAILRALAAAAVGALLAGGAAIALAFGTVRPGVGERLCIFAGLAMLAIGLWVLHDILSGHLRALARVEALAAALRHGRFELAALPPEIADDEIASGLHDALLALAADRRHLETLPDIRLAAVLANVSEALVLVTRNGQISLVNGPARMLLGDARVAVGTSVFDALDRAPLADAMRRAAASGEPTKARLATISGDVVEATVVDLKEHAGSLICIPAPAGPRRVEHDLSLHDVPPDAPAPDAATPLDRLPALVIDTETTGLDPATARVVALGAVRMFGPRLYRGVTVDCLVNPGGPIPPASTAIHGIDDRMVANAPPFRTQVLKLLDRLDGVIVIGHHIGFDIAVLKAESARAGLAWPEIPVLCTARLAAALDPDEPVLDLEAVAARHGVAVEGRHTALGDCLVTAELFGRMIARLADRGIHTLGAAQAFAARATRVTAHQRATGG